MAGERNMVKVALLIRLEAKPGKEEDVANFLRDGLPLVQAEPKTTAWFGIQLGPSTFGIFDAFPDESGRQAHLAGKVAAALKEKGGELFAEPPTIEQVDVLAAKLPEVGVRMFENDLAVSRSGSFGARVSELARRSDRGCRRKQA